MRVHGSPHRLPAAVITPTPSHSCFCLLPGPRASPKHGACHPFYSFPHQRAQCLRGAPAWVGATQGDRMALGFLGCSGVQGHGQTPAPVLGPNTPLMGTTDPLLPKQRVSLPPQHAPISLLSPPCAFSIPPRAHELCPCTTWRPDKHRGSRQSLDRTQGQQHGAGHESWGCPPPSGKAWHPSPCPSTWHPWGFATLWPHQAWVGVPAKQAAADKSVA